MSIEDRRLKTKVMLHSEMITQKPAQAYNQKASANNHVKAVKTRRHKKGGAVNTVTNRKICANIFKTLQDGENYSK
jgi:hypothetical protein